MDWQAAVTLEDLERALLKISSRLTRLEEELRYGKAKIDEAARAFAEAYAQDEAESALRDGRAGARRDPVKR